MVFTDDDSYKYFLTTTALEYCVVTIDFGRCRASVGCRVAANKPLPVTNLIDLSDQSSVRQPSAER